MPDSTNKGGRNPRVTEKELLDVFRATADPVLSTAEVAEQVPIKRRGVLSRLRSLESAEALESKQIGGRNTVWWLADEPAPHADVTPSESRADRSPPSDPTAADAAEERREHGGSEATATVDRNRLRDVLPGSGELLEARIDAIVAMYRYLQDHGYAEKTELLEVVDADEVGYASPDSVWANMIKGRDTLRALSGVESPPPGGGRAVWRYVEPDGKPKHTDGAGPTGGEADD